MTTAVLEAILVPPVSARGGHWQRKLISQLSGNISGPLIR
jgi:hypothetical protein